MARLRTEYSSATVDAPAPAIPAVPSQSPSATPAGDQLQLLRAEVAALKQQLADLRTHVDAENGEVRRTLDHLNRQLGA